MDSLRAKEEKYLDIVRECVASQKERVENTISQEKQEIILKQDNLKEHRSSMKLDEIPLRVDEINKLIEKYDLDNKAYQILLSALNSPYFGKIVFNDESFYVGKFGVLSNDAKQVLVNDWRAPVSSVYYDYEIGPAKYLAPDGYVEGNLTEKLQFKIDNGILKYIINTSLTISDDVLQQALAENTTNSLKTIVATIQKNQNQVIRKQKDQTTIVQGVAGSGKTSIALHRIAFLLYNYRGSLNSNNILIFSPSKVFSSYISNILPELGEQNVKETCFDEIFKAEFGSICNFETRPEQIERLLKTKTEVGENDYKNTLEFNEKLTKFLDEYFVKNFETRDVKVGKKEFSKEQLALYLEGRTTGSINDKLKYLANAIVNLVSITKILSEKGEELLQLSSYNAVLKMLKNKNIFKIYDEFLKEIGLKPCNKTYLLAEDAYALLYIKNYIFGANSIDGIKQVVIDEMQDYNPTALKIINQMHSCPKTILGDFHQMIDARFDEKKLEIVEKIFTNGSNNQTLRLNRNYRSTIENDALSNKILGIKNVEEPIRHGEAPEIVFCNEQTQAQNILHQIEVCASKGYQAIGILTKTSEEAALIYSRIKNCGRTIHLISPKTEYFEKGICVSAAHIVKGLEFDAVIVADASKNNFSTGIDGQSLYIATTRALHKIYINSVGEICEFLK